MCVCILYRLFIYLYTSYIGHVKGHPIYIYTDILYIYIYNKIYILYIYIYLIYIYIYIFI